MKLWGYICHRTKNKPTSE